MKKLLSLFSIVCPIIVFAQGFTLTPVSTPHIETFCGFSSFSDEVIPVGQNEESGESVTAYFFNSDFTFRKSVTVTPTINNQKGNFWVDWMENGFNLGTTFVASQHLFNDDDLFEFAVYGYVTVGKDESNNEIRLWAYLIYNENGQLLGSIPNNLVYPMGGSAYFKEYNDDKTSFVKLVANDSGGINAPYISKSNIKIHPNPASTSDYVTVTFNLPVESDCNITVIGSDGRIILKQNIAAGITALDLDASRLTKGVNIVNLIRGTQVLDTTKILIF